MTQREHDERCDPLAGIRVAHIRDERHRANVGDDDRFGKRYAVRGRRRAASDDPRGELLGDPERTDDFPHAAAVGPPQRVAVSRKDLAREIDGGGQDLVGVRRIEDRCRRLPRAP